MKVHGTTDNSGDQWRALDDLGLLWQTPHADDWLLAIDDTDNLTSRGTGFRARQLALRLARAKLASIKGITRHQLLVDPRIPYTSHNSAACIVLSAVFEPRQVFAFACDYLLAESAEGSDAGVTLIRRGAMPAAICAFGQAAQKTVLTQDQAKDLASQHGIPIAGLTGTGGGIIGALAATGLHAGGNDGRFLWIRNLRLLAESAQYLRALEDLCGVTVEGMVLPHALPQAHEKIHLGAWPRAVFRHHRPTLLVGKNNDPTNPEWRVAPREFIKQF